MKLRQIAILLLFVLPLGDVAALLLLNLPQALNIAIAALSALSAAAGVLTERWLFFAEAEHVVIVFYRGGSA
jgi:DMSO reductase anchor subunit